MGPNERGENDRGVTESAGVVILVAVTVVVTMAVGVNVLFVGQGVGPPDATFSYNYVDSDSALLITHVKGDEFPAGKLLIVGPDAQVTWAAAASINETRPVGSGDIVRISPGNEYGQPVSPTSTIKIYYVHDGKRMRLSTWPDDD